MVLPSLAWKLVLALALAAAILAGASARAPRRATPGAELRCLVFATLVLYAVGLGASLSRHRTIAAALYAGGTSISALAAWLSRGPGSNPSRGDQRADEPSPPDPIAPRFDWSAFERELQSYERRRPRQPIG